MNEGIPIGAAPRVVRAEDLRAHLPGPASERWPDGIPFAVGLGHGSMTVELYAPVGDDRQTPHAQDELYVVQQGAASLSIEGVAHPLQAGDVAFVRAGEEHRFEEFSADFATWVIFWGPRGGEQ